MSKLYYQIVPYKSDFRGFSRGYATIITEEKLLADIYKTVKKHRTRLSGVLALLFLIFANPTSRTLILSIPIIMSGEAIRIWSSGYIHKNRLLTTTGPYSISRNPLYVGSFLMGVGFMISMAVVWMMVLFFVFFLSVYWFTVRWEEDVLRGKFPGDWERYSSEVPRFISLASLAGYVPGEFSWAQVFRNRELWNASVVLAVYALLWGKYLFSGLW
jgi:hypothetical protein